jgi:hypothetical protein
MAAQASPEELSGLLAVVREHYLWDSTLPTDVAVSAFAEPPELLAHLTARARAEGKDRHWSQVRQARTGTRNPGMFGCDFELDYGALFLARGPRVFIAQVLPHSGAAAAGWTRGDEVLAVAPARAGLAAPERQTPALLGSGWWQALGPVDFGTRRWFRLRKPGTDAPVEVCTGMRMTRLDPVPESEAPRILERDGHRVGYLQLRGFHRWAEHPLRKVLGHYRKAGVTDLILDLRYNPGGSLETAALLLSLLRAGAAPTEVMFQLQGQAGQLAQIQPFWVEPEALGPARLAVIVTHFTASAAECLVSALLPYYGRDLALVGERTHGKPVVIGSFPIPSSPWVVALPQFRMLNALGEGDYFQGLPDAPFRGSSAAAEDDLGHPLGHPDEASTAAAMAWIVHGARARGPIAPATD